jgi:hypothetical protein
MAHYNSSGLWIPERSHSPREASEVECKDCFSAVGDPDEEYCLRCSEPLCTECQVVLADEPLCNRCFALLKKAALASLQNDPLVGDLFSAEVAA